MNAPSMHALGSVPLLENNPDFFARFQPIWCLTYGKVTTHETTGVGMKVFHCVRNVRILRWKSCE